MGAPDGNEINLDTDMLLHLDESKGSYMVTALELDVGTWKYKRQ